MENLAKALCAFQGECPRIDLDETVKVTTRTGGSYNFKYATLGNIRHKVQPTMTKNGLAITQGLLDDELHTTLMHVSGEQINYHTKIDMTGSMQDIGSRLTYMRRYSFAMALGIVADDDDDANIAAGNKVDRKEAKLPASNPETGPEFTQAMQLIETADSTERLKEIWSTFKTFQGVKTFKDSITSKKKELQKVLA